MKMNVAFFLTDTLNWQVGEIFINQFVWKNEK